MNGSSPTAASVTAANDKASHPALAVAVSGGSDSLALLWVTWKVASALGLRTIALHVHHGLQAAADAWPQWLVDECQRWSQAHPERWPVQVVTEGLRGRPARGQSIEDWARQGRYEALVRMAQAQGLDLVLLAHHRRDQAETLLLQALRGAGPHGLAAMPSLHWRQGVCLARPWLDQPRETVRALARGAGLRPVEDPSNDDSRYARNRLRLAVWPALEQAFPQAEAALALAAQRCAQALEPLNEQARADAVRCGVPQGGRGWRLRVRTDEWAGLSPARRSWALRHWISQSALKVPSAVVDQLATFDFASNPTGRWSLGAGIELRWYRGVLEHSTAVGQVGSSRRCAPASAEPSAVTLKLSRAGRRRVRAWAGSLTLRQAASGEAGLEWALPLEVSLRPRRGDDQFLLSPNGVARSLKKQFQSAGVPAWAREGPVVTAADGAMLMVPGLGMDARATTPGGRWVLEWHADSATGQD